MSDPKPEEVGGEPLAPGASIDEIHARVEHPLGETASREADDRALGTDGQPEAAVGVESAPPFVWRPADGGDRGRRLSQLRTVVGVLALLWMFPGCLVVIGTLLVIVDSPDPVLTSQGWLIVAAYFVGLVGLIRWWAILVGHRVAPRLRLVRSRTEKEAVRDAFITQGYEVLREGDTTTLMRRHTWGSAKTHVVIALLTGWLTLGIGNVIYAVVEHRRADQVQLELE